MAADGEALFEVDNRGSDLFVMLSIRARSGPALGFTIGGESLTICDEHVAFVALKNGEHNGIGYFLDTGAAHGSVPAEFPLADLPSRIMAALNVDGAAQQTA